MNRQLTDTQCLEKWIKHGSCGIFLVLSLGGISTELGTKQRHHKILALPTFPDTMGQEIA
jgi:hypothetical protein